MINKALSIPGWMSEAELNWLAEHAKESLITVEFGCYLGRSTRALADNTNGIVYAVDPWDGIYYENNGKRAEWLNTAVMDVFIDNLKDHVDSGKVLPIKEFSWAFKVPVRANLVFIDGDHRYDEVKSDIYKALSILKSGGIISGHDYTHPDWPGVKQAVDELLGTVHHCDSIWWTKII